MREERVGKTGKGADRMGGERKGEEVRSRRGEGGKGRKGGG